MPNSARKPRGTHQSYVACVTWLADEHPKKFIFTRKWEEIKLLIDRMPPPDRITTVVMGMPEPTIESAIEVINSQGWDVKILGRACTPEDVVHLPEGVPMAYRETIEMRIAAYLKSIEDMNEKGARKRLRFDRDQGGAAADAERANDTTGLGLIEEGEDEDADDEAAGGASNGKAYATQNGAPMDGPQPSWADEEEMRDQELDGADARDDAAATGCAAAAEPETVTISAAEFKSLQNKVEMMMHAMFEPRSVGLYNVSIMKDETPPNLMKKIQMIFNSVGLHNEGSNITKVSREGQSTTVKITFGDERAVNETIERGEVFHPKYWESRNVQTIKGMCEQQKNVTAYLRGKGMYIQNNGYLKVDRWKRGMPRERTTATRADAHGKKPKPSVWA